MSETVGDRVRAVREARGEKQPQFAVALTAAAKRLGISEIYDNTMVSKMEVGRREVTLEDALVIASVDKKSRGREWLAWGDSQEIKVAIDPHIRDRAETSAAPSTRRRKRRQA